MSTSTKTPSKTSTKPIPLKPSTTVTKPTFKQPAKSAATPTTLPTSKSPAAPRKVVLAVKKVPTKTVVAKVNSTQAAKAPVAKPIKPKKVKLVRDSFTIPKPEYLILDNLKLRAADLKHPVKKSELLRAGIKALDAMSDAQLLLALKAVPMLKTGRPSK